MTAAGLVDQSVGDAADDGATGNRGVTPKKGRPTPSRKEVERARGIRQGPVAPAPASRKEARERRKEARNSLSKEERKELSRQRRSERSEARNKMMSGDERYLLARDKGPERRLARDLVDSRRYVMNYFMIVAILVVFLLFIQSVTIQLVGQAVFVALFIVIAVEGIFIGRRVNRIVRERYPDTEVAGFSLGWYAVMRAIQLRSMRAPKPQVSPGSKV